jgi:parallel beta-helix repeat protein
MMLSTPKFGQRAIAVFFLAILIVSACQITNTTADTKSQNMIVAEVKGTPHAPIHITSNSDFASQASANGWPGDGSQGNPYIIDGYDIDGQGGTYCIWIENTDVWFVIRNCNLWNATSDASEPWGTGISLKNVTNGTLANNHCSSNSRGILLYSSSNYNNITNNNCSGNSYYGISLYSSSNYNITNNNCSGNTNGVYLYSSSNYNNITNNNCSGNSHGISLYSSSNNNITNNNCSGNSRYGIYLYSSSYNNITNNNCSYNSYYGILLDSSSNNNITYNNFYHNTQYAINITSSSTGNAIHHNNFWQNNGAGKGVNGNCQAYDSAGGNAWYENTAHEGNYWSNWNGLGWGTPDAYPIQGATGAYDMYPLSHPAVVLRPPSAPQNLTVVAGNTTAILTWEPPADDGGTPITNYTIYYHTKTGGSPEKIVVGNITTYTFSGLTNGQTYYFAVSAINKAGEGEKSNEVRATPCTTPSPPQNLTAVAGNRNVTLTWEPPADNGGMAVTNYTVYYGTSPGNYTNNITLGNITNYTITGLINGQRYYFAVSAINAVGESPKSNEVFAMPCTVPSAPQNLTAVAGNGNVTLTWQPPADNGGMPITGYRIYYGTSSGNYTVNITVGNITSYTITGLTNGQKYYFSVSAINAVGEGPKSNEASATPAAEQQHGKTPGFDVLVGICAIAVSMVVIALERRKKR